MLGAVRHREQLGEDQLTLFWSYFGGGEGMCNTKSKYKILGGQEATEASADARKSKATGSALSKSRFCIST